MSGPTAVPGTVASGDGEERPAIRELGGGTPVRVERFAGAPSEWDAFVERATGATHCHRHGWQDVMRDVFGHECIYLAARTPSGALDGVLPLVRVKSLLFGHYLMSMPFLNYGGPVGSDQAVAALIAAAAEQGDRDGVTLLELRNRVPWRVPVPDGWAASTRKITVVLDLTAPTNGAERSPTAKKGKGSGTGAAGAPDDGVGAVAAGVWKRLDGKLRSQIRRPQKEGVTVRFGPDQIEPFFSVFAHHMRDLGTPTQSRRLFEAVGRAFPNDVWFGCAYLQEQPVACGCGFQWGTEFEMTWASALNEHKRLAPNMLLYWAFMERAVERGLTHFNFGRCTLESGPHRFKRQWGTQDEQLWWYDRVSGGRDAIPAKTPSPDDAAYAWGPRLWKRLPLAVATALGPRVVKYLP